MQVFTLTKLADSENGSRQFEKQTTFPSSSVESIEAHGDKHAVVHFKSGRWEKVKVKPEALIEGLWGSGEEKKKPGRPKSAHKIGGEVQA